MTDSWFSVCHEDMYPSICSLQPCCAKRIAHTARACTHRLCTTNYHAQAVQHKLWIMARNQAGGRLCAATRRRRPPVSPSCVGTSTSHVKLHVPRKTGMAWANVVVWKQLRWTLPLSVPAWWTRRMTRAKFHTRAGRPPPAPPHMTPNPTRACSKRTTLTTFACPVYSRTSPSGVQLSRHDD